MQREENSITSKSLAWTVNCPCDENNGSLYVYATKQA